MNAMQKWIFGHRGLTPHQRLLLLYYCARANGDLACFPSFSTTADDCGLARRYVILGTRQLCAGGYLSVVTDTTERAAILAKAGAKDNCRANVYRINYSNGAQHAPSDSAQHAPTQKSNGARGALTEADLLAMCRAVDGERSAPTEAPDGASHAPGDGAPGAPGMVHQDARDGAPGAPELKNELKETELAREAEASHGGQRHGVRAALTGAPAEARPQEAETPNPPPEPAATPSGGGATNAFRPPRPPSVPFEPAQSFETFLNGLRQKRPAALAVHRPRAIYAAPEVLQAARQRLMAVP